MSSRDFFIGPGNPRLSVKAGDTMWTLVPVLPLLDSTPDRNRNRTRSRALPSYPAAPKASSPQCHTCRPAQPKQHRQARNPSGREEKWQGAEDFSRMLDGPHRDKGCQAHVLTPLSGYFRVHLHWPTAARRLLLQSLRQQLFVLLLHVIHHPRSWWSFGLHYSRVLQTERSGFQHSLLQFCNCGELIPADPAEAIVACSVMLAVKPLVHPWSRGGRVHGLICPEMYLKQKNCHFICWPKPSPCVLMFKAFVFCSCYGLDNVCRSLAPKWPISTWKEN